MVDAWVEMNLLPFMTLKAPNRNRTVYGIKRIVEEQTGVYISAEHLQDILAEKGYRISQHYPISEYFFRRYQHGR